MKDPQRWIEEHLERLREETADWPAWMKKPIRPAKQPLSDARQARTSKPPRRKSA